MKNYIRKEDDINYLCKELIPKVRNGYYISFSYDKYYTPLNQYQKKYYVNNRLKFPKDITIISRKHRTNQNNISYDEKIVTKEWGILYLNYFYENIIVDIPESTESSKRKLCKILGGEIVGDNKLISIKRR